MKKIRGIVIFITALALTLVIVSQQLAWNVRTPKYLQSTAARAGTNEAVAAALPDYAASKLPNPEATKAAFAQYVTPRTVRETLDSLFTSIPQAYSGKTDIIAIDLSPLTLPIVASGYQIPPGTVFANDTIQVGGLAAVLRLSQRSLVPGLLFLTVSLLLVVLLSIKRGIVASIRDVLLVTCLLLIGIFVATLGVPLLVSSLVTTNSLDATLREILLTFTKVLITDAGHFYLAWVAGLATVAVIMSIGSGLMHHAHRPRKRHTTFGKKPASSPPSQSKEL